MKKLINIDGFYIKELIHESEKTKVYKGIRKKDELAVIIKLLNKSHPTINELTTFSEEFKIGKKINNAGENVIQTYDLQKYENTLFLVLEDAGGETLKEIIKRKKLTLKEFLLISIKIANSLHGIHSQNIIHKDIKPEHIIWNEENSILKIFDFSISTQFSREITEKINPNKPEGTLHYISPEQTGRINRSVDYRTDLYSLGVVLYETLTGIMPFTGNDLIEIIHSHITKIPDKPSKINKNIPQTISDIVMKLLEKTAEERYQSCAGLKYDLEKCLDLLTNEKTIEHFEIAKKDFSDKFQLPQKIYGRDKELKIIINSFNSILKGANSFITITGTSGIGKSALVNEIQKPIAEKKGYFVTGKFNQYNENIPYSAIAQAFVELTNEILSEQKKKLEHKREKLLKVFGPNGQLLIDIIPELEQIIGKQPAVQKLNPAEARNRFIMIFRNFVKVIAKASHPLVIFLDDMQWCDAASLNLIKDFTTKEIPHLMIICSYRKKDVGEGHPFHLALDEIQKTKVINKIQLTLLPYNIVNQIIADTLHSSVAEVKSLSKIIYKKSKGNPFFTYELIKNLYKQKLLNVNHKTGRWKWELDKINNTNISDNVVEFMIGRLQTLNNDCIAVLKYASCIGSIFDLNTLSIIMQQPINKLSEILKIAISEEIIIPKMNRYADGDFYVYKFQHTRIQQAAYSLISNLEKQKVHLMIGRLLLKNYTKEEKKEHLIEIVNHLNTGHLFITDNKEKEQLTVLNLKSGNKALNTQAYSSAFIFFKIGISLLSDNYWQNNYQTSFDLYKGFSQTAYLTGKQKEAEQHIEILIKNAKTKIEKIDIISMRLRQYATIGKLEEAIEEGIKGLALVGIKLSAKPSMANIFIEIIKVKVKIGKRKIADLINEPIMEDAEKKITMRLLSEIGAPAYVLGNETLFGILSLKLINLSLRYGNSPESPFAYIAYGMLISEAFGDYKSSYEFSKLAIKLNDKLNDIEYKCRIIAAYGVLTNHWNNHWSTQTELFKKGIEAGFNSGDLFYLANSALNCIIWDPKLHIEKKIKQYSKYMSIIYDTDYKDVILTSEIYLQKLRCLCGQTKDNLSMDDDNFSEEKFLVIIKERKYLSGIAFYNFHKADINLLFDKHLQAYKYVKKVDKNIKSIVGLNYISLLSKLAFHSASACLTDNSITSIKKSELWKRMKNEQKKMEKWAKYNPVNYKHLLLTMKAETAKHKKNFILAVDLYRKAIVTANKNEWYKDEAFANELAAKFFIEQGQDSAAVGYLQEAHYQYFRWGASAKVKHIEEKYHSHLRLFTNMTAKYDNTQNQTGTISGTTTITTTNNTTIHGSNTLDLLTIIKSSQAISGEIVLKTLFQKLMQIVIENAGATRGVLILSQNNELRIRAEIDVENKKADILQNVLIYDYKKLPKLLINYVENSKNTVVLPDKSNKEKFSQDLYFIKNNKMSVFVIPIIRQNKLYGILYLENNIITNAFTSHRQDILNLLSSQIAVSIENALLYENLEEKVNQRTNELSLSNSKLQVLFKQQTIQKEKIEKNHENIKAGIDYASRIQTAMLPEDNFFGKYFADHFILFMPCEIVSGDFYWAKETENILTYATADCTGHGVPGAFVSMLGISLLNEINSKYKHYAANEILNSLRSAIKKLLNQTSIISESKDGMDIALCIIDLNTNKLQFAGAYNSLYIIRNNKIIVLNADRQPIGIHRRERSFTNHEFQLQKDDILYSFSDGYMDQLGGKHKRKLMSKKFKKYLFEIHQKPMIIQKKLLIKKFHKWKGNIKQTDDIIILGTRIKK